jgi:glycerophosphoryl diester phosphodiesterase
MSMLVSERSTPGDIIATDLASRAHAVGLEIHPYTFRMESSEIPPYAQNYTDLMNIFLCQIDVEGVFTDFTDKAVRFLKYSENGCIK